MKFTKMHGIGNCYLYFNCFEDPVLNPEDLSVRLSDVHFGVGSDGIILIEPSEIADCRTAMTSTAHIAARNAPSFARQARRKTP